MSRHVFYFDITGQTGLLQSLISSAQAYSSRFEPEVQEWFASPHQIQFLENMQTQTVALNEEAWPAVKMRIQELTSQQNDGHIFHVVSNNKKTLNSAAEMNSRQVDVHAHPLSSILSPSEISNAAELSPRGLSLVEAVALTKKVLRLHGHCSRTTAIRRADLRPLLLRHDQRADKDAPKATAKLISKIFQDGIDNKWLGAKGPKGEEHIWLETDSTRGHGILGVFTEDPVKLTSPEGLGNESDRGRIRTKQMIDCLKNSRVYSPKPIRDYIFKAIRSMAAEENTFPVPACQFARQARIKAAKDAAERGVAFQYWPVAADAILEALLFSKALYGEDGKVIAPGLHARGALVFGVAADFEDRCEILLLELIIAKLKNVTRRDRTSLAHALFKAGKDANTLDEMMDRLDALFFKLRFRLAEDVDGRLTVEADVSL